MTAETTTTNNEVTEPPKRSREQPRKETEGKRHVDGEQRLLSSSNLLHGYKRKAKEGADE